jgi:hypothetical protein
MCLRAANIFNLKGDKTFQELCTYILGYALRRYTIHERIIHNPWIGTDMITMHALLSMVAMT